jgi:hypothetical protein
LANIVQVFNSLQLIIKFCLWAAGKAILVGAHDLVENKIFVQTATQLSNKDNQRDLAIVDDLSRFFVTGFHCLLWSDEHFAQSSPFNFRLMPIFAISRQQIIASILGIILKSRNLIAGADDKLTLQEFRRKCVFDVAEKKKKAGKMAASYFTLSKEIIVPAFDADKDPFAGIKFEQIFPSLNAILFGLTSSDKKIESLERAMRYLVQTSRTWLKQDLALFELVPSMAFLIDPMLASAFSCWLLTNLGELGGHSSVKVPACLACLLDRVILPVQFADEANSIANRLGLREVDVINELKSLAALEPPCDHDDYIRKFPQNYPVLFERIVYPHVMQISSNTQFIENGFKPVRTLLLLLCFGLGARHYNNMFPYKVGNNDKNASPSTLSNRLINKYALRFIATMEEKRKELLGRSDASPTSPWQLGKLVVEEMRKARTAVNIATFINLARSAASQRPLSQKALLSKVVGGDFSSVPIKAEVCEFITFTRECLSLLEFYNRR